MSNYYYKFPAVRGIQAENEYYICMIPCKLLSKLFTLDSNNIMPEFRAQRKVNFSRIPQLKKYILGNRDSYVFSALAASIDGDFIFNSLNNSDLGFLQVDMSATFLINDGQHRKTALEAAIEEDDSIANETISVVFFKDKGLRKSQQIFTDLNKHAVITSKSLNTLYNAKDPIAVLTTDILDKITFFKIYTDKEQDTLGKYSKSLFTLNNFYNANIKLFAGVKNIDKYHDFTLNYWDLISKNIVEWNELQDRLITKKSLREDYIVTQGVVLLAFGKLGNYFIKNIHLSMDVYLRNLQKINWLRSNPIWENRTIINGRIVRKESNITLTYFKIKELIGLDLTNDEKMINENVNH